jgi:hypothetical protein
LDDRRLVSPSKRAAGLLLGLCSTLDRPPVTHCPKYNTLDMIQDLSQRFRSFLHRSSLSEDIMEKILCPFTYDHRTLKIRLPVRSAIYKQCTGGLVVRWVTTSESPLLYVFLFGFLLDFFLF